jgi:hypothetical protein
MSLAYLIPAALLTIRLLSPATREAVGRPALRARPVATRAS